MVDFGVLSAPQVRRLSGHFRSKASSYCAWRDALFFDTLVATRLPELDLLTLATEAVLNPLCADDGWKVAVWNPAMQKRNLVRFPCPLVQELKEFVKAARPKVLRATETNRVFISACGKPLDLAWARRLLSSASAKTGIPLQIQSPPLPPVNVAIHHVAH